MMTEEFDALSRVLGNSNGSGPVPQLSPNTRSHLLRWYSGNPFDASESTVKRALKAFEWCEENSDIFDCPPEIRRARLKTGADTLEISVGLLSDLMARASIFHRPARACRLIAFEGIDDAENRRQIDLLRSYLIQRNIGVATLTCPEYGGFFGREIFRLQGGDDVIHESAVDPRSMALWAAVDRKSSISEVLMQADGVIISNRYTLSNAAFQSATTSVDLADWVFQLEHTHLGIPAPDFYVVLDALPPVDSIETKQPVGPEPRSRKKDDVVRRMEAVRHRYREYAARFPHIQIVECTADNREAKPPEEIHQQVLACLRGNRLLE